MPSNKEKILESHIKANLMAQHRYRELSTANCADSDFHFVPSLLIQFIRATQKDKYDKLHESYGADTDDEILKALRDAAGRAPLWLAMRNGVMVRGQEFRLCYPKPRSGGSSMLHTENIFAVKSQYHFSADSAHSIDLMLFLNGLPVVAIELKHEDEGQNVHDAVQQFAARAQGNRIFELPFLYIAADTSEVKVATNPRSEDNFQWFNQGLANLAVTPGEYPIEYLYRDALSPDSILEYLSFFLLYTPPENRVDETGVRVIKDAATIFPRYHQLRSTRRIAGDLLTHYNSSGRLGRKYLVNHSAGSGKTLTMAWLAERLDSLYADDGRKLLDIVFVLTDRRSLDKNIKDDLRKFTHLQGKLGLTDKSEHLRKYIGERRSIIVTTMQKFSYIQELLEEDEGLKGLRVGFIIDEAHRSQDGKMALATRALFTRKDEADRDEEQDEQSALVAELEHANINNQVLVAFTATPVQRTVDFFGQPIDEYTEDEAIREGYIKDVATNIVTYQTLYHLRSRAIIPDDELYPAGLIHKALRDVAYRDPELIQYKSEVMLLYFEEHVKGALHGTAKAMVVASSRPAGLLYFQTLQEKIAAKGCDYKVLFAFSDYTDEHGLEIKEDEVNELSTVHVGKLIETVFDEGAEYRIMVVANKFQVGFNQPKLTAMFLDKPVRGVNAVQTLSRLNRNYPGKDTPMVVDFTNSAEEIFQAFRRYRNGSRFNPSEPNPEVLQSSYTAFLGRGIFTEGDIIEYTALVKDAMNDGQFDAALMALAAAYRQRFIEAVPDKDAQREVVLALNHFVSSFYFISLFFALPEYLIRFGLFAEGIADKLMKAGNISSLSRYLKELVVERSAVRYRGIIAGGPTINEPIRNRPAEGGGRAGVEPPRASIPEVMEGLRTTFQITDEEAILINEVVEHLMQDETLVETIRLHQHNDLFMHNFRYQLRQRVVNYYLDHNWDERLMEGPYVAPGGIIDYIVNSVVSLSYAMAA